MKVKPILAGVMMTVGLISGVYAVSAPASKTTEATPLSVASPSVSAPTATAQHASVQSTSNPSSAKAKPAEANPVVASASTQAATSVQPAPSVAPPSSTAPATTVPSKPEPPKTASVPTANPAASTNASSTAVSAVPGATVSPLPVIITLSADQQKQIEAVVHNYLLKNPEILIEAIQALQQKQVDQAQKSIQKTQENAPKMSDALFHQAKDPIAGNAVSKVTIVDFFDYQCPHCSKMTPILGALIKSNSNLRVVFKEFPIRGAISEFAAKIALASKNQGKYFEFHKALMEQSLKPEPLTEDLILKIAKTSGLDVAKLKVDMKSDAINQQIKENLKLGQDLQLLGTPAFFIAKSDILKTAKPSDITFIPGQIDQVQLQKIIDKNK